MGARRTETFRRATHSAADSRSPLGIDPPLDVGSPRRYGGTAEHGEHLVGQGSRLARGASASPVTLLRRNPSGEERAVATQPATRARDPGYPSLVRTIEIARDDAGQRVDRFLRKYLASATLGHVFKLLRTKQVRVNGRRARPEQRLVEGDEVEFRLPDERLSEMAQKRAGARSAPATRSLEALSILHRDEHVLAVDKPPMLLVQAGERPDEPTLDRLVLDLVGEGEALTFRPSLAHRLDRGTSGVVLLGLSAPGLRGLTAAFRERRVTKRYLALVHGRPKESAFRVDLPLQRTDTEDRRGARVRVSHGPDAQSASTEMRVVATSPDGQLTLIEARPMTGRTHQIRVHLRASGLPIVGDPAYGDPERVRQIRGSAGLWRTFLHAWRIELVHPVSGEPLVVESPLPSDLRRTLQMAEIAFEPGAER